MTSDEDLLRQLRRVIPRPRPPLKVRLAESMWTLVGGLAFVVFVAGVSFAHPFLQIGAIGIGVYMLAR